MRIKPLLGQNLVNESHQDDSTVLKHNNKIDSRLLSIFWHDLNNIVEEYDMLA